MADDTYSAEILALDGVGDKLSAAITNAETRTYSFDGCVMAADGDICFLTKAMPSGAMVLSVTITELAGTGNLDIGTSGGTEKDIFDDLDPTVLTTYPVNKKSCGGQTIYATGEGAVTIGGYITYIVK